MISFLEAAPIAVTRTWPTFRRQSRLQVDVEQALEASGHRLMKLVGCDVDNGAVVLYGTVPTFYLKQVAQESVMRLRLVKRVDNQVEVRPR